MVECVFDPSVPVTVTVYVPGATAAPTETVSVELPPAVTELGFNDTVGPVGLTLALRLTVPALPDTTAVEIALVPLAPCWMVRLLGAALMLKSFGGGAVTVTVTVVEWIFDPSVPVTVTV